MMWVEEKECSVKISVVHNTFNVLKTTEKEKRQIIATIKFIRGRMVILFLQCFVI